MLADYTVDYNVATGRTSIQNPLPKRALDTRAKDPGEAMYVSGVGRINWSIVEGYSSKDVNDFKKRLEIGSLLQGNAKTEKPRPGGRLGVIKGLSLAPHFYPNLLNLIDVKPTGAIVNVDKAWFNAFNGRLPLDAARYAEVDPNQLINFCKGSSKYCRQTCLVTTGQHPSTLQAAHAKMKFTYAFLSEPELFVATLYRQLVSFGKASRKRGYDAVVRLNMLSDLPWYSICPELLEALEGLVVMYDYTKNEFWKSEDYQRVAHLLDLTYSFSGSNDKSCVEALNAGHRVAVAFAPKDPKRSTAVQYRTTWKEIIASGLVEPMGDDRWDVKDLFGKNTGTWEIVDGDKSDYRIDDPARSIVALNFKQPTIRKAVAPHLAEALPESRAFFAKHVPDDEGLGIEYVRLLAKRTMWKDLFGEDHLREVQRKLKLKNLSAAIKKEQEKLSVMDVIRMAHEYETGEPWTRYDAPEVPAVVPDDLTIAMTPVEGTNLLAGPHVPVVVND